MTDRILTIRQAYGEIAARAEHMPEAVQAARAVVLEEAVQEIEESWPIETGVSQEGWDHDETAVINNAVDERGRPYVSYVHDGLADKLVPLVLEGLVERFAEVLEQELESAAEASHG